MTSTNHQNHSKNRKLAVIASLCFGLACLPQGAFGADFSGALKGVTITDSSGANVPPTAAFSITRQGNVFSFDATTSGDSDGSIAKYGWDFGDGSVATGASVSHTFTTLADFPVTLTVVDDGGAVALAQETIFPGIRDDFSVDSARDYVDPSEALAVYGGAAHARMWQTVRALNKTSLGTPDHFVEADVYYTGAGLGGGVIVRGDIDQQTGYAVFFESGRLMVHSFSGSAEQWVSHYDGEYQAGVYHLRLEIKGDLLTAYVNGQRVLSKTVTMYPSGNYIGVRIRPGDRPDDVYVDNLKGGWL